MIAKRLTFFHIHKIIKYLINLLLTFFVIILFWVGVLFFQQQEKDRGDTNIIGPSQAKVKPAVHYEKIGQGALSASSTVTSLPLFELKQEINILRNNTRPDFTVDKLCILTSLKSSGQLRKITSEEKIYLTYNEGLKPYLQFSSEPTPLWIRPCLTETGTTQIELGMHLLTDSKLFEERQIFMIEDFLQKEGPTNKDLSFQEAANELKKGHWWAPDRLFESYGGKHYQMFKNHERIELERQGSSTVFHVKQGDILIWENKKWVSCQLGQRSREAILAQVKSITCQQMEWELWNADGIEQMSLTHIREKPEILNDCIEDIFSRIRQRTASLISCQLGNKAIILRSGDWIFHTSSGWRVLRSLQEIDNVLTFQSKGQLFVFDGIEKRAGKLIFLGTLFDLMRTQKQSVKVPIVMQNQAGNSNHKKKLISTKIRSKSLEEELYTKPIQQQNSLYSKKINHRTD